MTAPDLSNSCVLVAEVGPNPAPLTEVLWALARQRSLSVREAYLVTHERRARYLEREVLAPGAALDQLRASLADVAPALLARDAVHVRYAVTPAGERLDEERTPEESAAWAEARWNAARDAVRSAEAQPAVFALLGGRKRSGSAIQSVVFQFLARRQDLLLDVRVSDRRVEGGTGFFFPEQRGQRIATARGEVTAASVSVFLVDVPVPRLRRLFAEQDLSTFANATAAGGRALDELAPPTLTIDLAARTATVDGAPIGLSVAQFAWYAALAVARVAGDDDGWLTSDSTETLRSVLQSMIRHGPPAWEPPAQCLRDVLANSAPEGAALSKLKADTVKRVRQFCRAQGIARRHEALLVPERKTSFVGDPTAKSKLSRQRIAIEPERVVISGFDAR